MIYVVQFGDTLSQIAERLYGDHVMCHEIALWNDIRDLNLIRTGQVLKLNNPPKMLTQKQKVVNVEPSIEKLDEICDLFREGFCTREMALDIYRTAIK